MSGYGSIRTVRKAIIDTLNAAGRNPDAYNIAGIARDAFTPCPDGGYSAEPDPEFWDAAVKRHRRPFGRGDMVRIVVTTGSGATKHHYGKISQFRKANGGIYRRWPVKPHSAYVELEHHAGGWFGPLTDVTPALDDYGEPGMTYEMGVTKPCKAHEYRNIELDAFEVIRRHGPYDGVYWTDPDDARRHYARRIAESFGRVADREGSKAVVPASREYVTDLVKRIKQDCAEWHGSVDDVVSEVAGDHLAKHALSLAKPLQRIGVLSVPAFERWEVAG
ncbi:hypothetical protein OG232_04330 [Streptomyces sp. NBC_01411]|uniref:hypothetical protein n=1 Tax=Streptomyces sp. NBC_01411 TaxID=2903857 RepID=UPI003245B1F2